ncbi:hypothetical protein BOTBODRAFT_410675 [Botryobasidium botryosum FD-172 SS1]|uniref:Uncharacterized protein n=1 Tax=Botryobasidium botryosum (strain FD-172 SS1) TaxID=930990 RepID=A0A067MB51_BOTB1|nr:hypothetical protein BOTBODRAFT_410675 [Botryobasidium botryosum FD-172 SS1]
MSAARPPPAYRTSVPPTLIASAERQEVFRRRTARLAEERPFIGRIQRLSTIVSTASVPAIVVYAVFFADFGEEEHCFSPARRWLDQKRDAFWTLSPSEREASASRPTQPVQPSSGSATPSA